MGIRLRARVVPMLAAVICSGSGVALAETAYPTDAVSVASGRELAEIHCAACHGVGEDDASAQPLAPAFRFLGRRYPVSALEESLAEGIVTGHEGMPEFAFEADDIDAFLGYLTVIQQD